jgi:glycogen debranching enzyme
MYDGVPITRAGANQPCLLPLHDAGMTGLYLAQCDALADLADVVNRTADAAELRGRVAAMTKTLNERLWHEDIGVYSNRYSGDNASGSGGGSGLFLDHISPFNFHPMMSGAATEEQARRMVTTWLTAEQGFCLPPQQPLHQQQQQQQPACKFGLPSIARSDKAFTDQNYWRGRTWGPMNFLVYQGLAHPRYANVSEVQYAKAALANASRALLLKEWTDKHHVCENYNAMTGTGGDVSHCNPFYTW